MLLSSSSRAAAPKPLKFGATTKSTDRYLSIKHLLPSTPIGSPSLPSILPRHGKKPPKLNSRKIVRFILWLSFVIGIYYLISFGKKGGRNPGHGHPPLGAKDSTTFATSSGQTYEIVEASELPEHPTPLALTDSSGKHHWTISIPDASKFPLSPTEYFDICSQADEVARHVAGSDGQHYEAADGNSKDYYYEDPNFIDVDSAISRNLLPSTREKSSHPDDIRNNLPICDRSLTYVLSGHDASLGSALLGLWLSYALSLREQRTFFIDDTHFPYGNYTTFFANKLPPPKCRLPPPSHRFPCPHQAKHLIVSAATTSWTFGAEFHAHFSQEEIFALARTGYEALWHLRPEDETYILNRASKLRNPNPTISNSPTANDEGSPLSNGLVGMHIRRGDRHPFSLAYSRNYIPPSTYMATALRLVGQNTQQWTFLLASDDADLYNSNHPDLPNVVRAQERVSLASKKALEKMGVKSGLGWEGGFFKDVFWGLGLSEEEKLSTKRSGKGNAGVGYGSPMPMKEKGRFGEKDVDGREKRVHHHDNSKPHKSSQPKSQKGLVLAGVEAAIGDRDYRTDPTKEALQLRELIGRAYLLDLAVLAQSDKVVCAVSANACRILAVMLGWERMQTDWHNIDGLYEWRVMDY